MIFEDKCELQPMVVGPGCLTRWKELIKLRSEAEEKLTKNAQKEHKEFASLSFSEKARDAFRKTLSIWRKTCRYYLLSFQVIFWVGEICELMRP